MSLREFWDYFVIGFTILSALPLFMKGCTGLLSYSRKSELASLRKGKDLMLRLKASDREYLGWLLSRFLIVAALISVASMFRVIESSPGMTSALPAVLQWVLYVLAYFVAVYALGINRQLGRFDIELARICAKIDRLEVKLAGLTRARASISN